MSTNRIGGDYNLEALEAFRSAYANQLQTPEDLDTDSRTGLPTGEISNTSPWLATTGLWKYPSGKGPESDLRTPFNPQEFITQDDEVNLDEMTEEELDAYLDTLSEDELVASSSSAIKTSIWPDTACEIINAALAKIQTLRFRREFSKTQKCFFRERAFHKKTMLEDFTH